MWKRLTEGNDYDYDDYDYNELGRNPSSTDAYRRTRESFDKRKKRDPSAERRASDRDNVDHDWEDSDYGEGGSSRYDDRTSEGQRKSYLRRKLEEWGVNSDEIGRDGPQWTTQYKRYLNTSDRDNNRDSNNWFERSRRDRGDTQTDSTFTDMGWEELDERTASDNNRDWRNYMRHGRKDELYRRKDKDQGKKRDGKKSSTTSHLVCVDDTPDAMRAFRHAAKRLPKGDRLILTHGVYEGSFMGSSRADEERLVRVRSKFLNACSDLDRQCEFKTLRYSSTGHFGEEVCDLAERIGAQSVIVGKRAEVSDMRRRLVGSASKSVLSYCHLPVQVIAHDK